MFIPRPKQQEVLAYTGGYMGVSAVPGSGKTHTLSALAAQLIASGRLADDPGLEPLSAAHDRMMMCGSPDMLRDLVEIVRERGFEEGNSSNPRQYVIEKAFVER
jgi:hypothetical protein